MFPHSPVEMAIMAEMTAAGIRRTLRIERIKADPRIIRLRAMKADAIIDTERKLFTNLLSGNSSRSARITRLIRARTGQIDKNRAAVQINLREAATCRHTHWSLVA